MSVAYAVRTQCKKLMKLGSIFCRDFNSSKCKTWAKMTTARIKLLRNKREAVVKQMRRDVALLLQSGQDSTARIRVEHVIREQNMMAANEILELFCERIVTRLSIIAKQRHCPADLKEAISSLIFAGPRCSDIPELLAIRDIFQKKYGKDFVSAATDLRPESGVNRLLIEKLSVQNPTGELKLKIMKEIAKEYQVDWDTTETEAELLKPPEERIEAPRTFISASSLPLNPVTTRSTEADRSAKRLSGGGEMGANHFEDAAAAARAAADSAKDAIAAAQAAAQLAHKTSSNNDIDHDHPEARRFTSSSLKTQSFGGRSRFPDTTSLSPGEVGEERSYYRRHSCNISSGNSDIKFDESDCDEEIEVEPPPNGRSPPREPPQQRGISHHPVHPKLPDYDTLAARFEALKYRKSQP